MRIATLYPTHLFFSDHTCQVTWYIGEPRNVTNIPRSTQKTMFIPWKLFNYNKDIYLITSKFYVLSILNM